MGKTALATNIAFNAAKKLQDDGKKSSIALYYAKFGNCLGPLNARSRQKITDWDKPRCKCLGTFFGYKLRIIAYL